MLCTPHNKHQPQMPGGRIRDRATKHPGAGCLLSQEQGKKGLNHLSSPVSICWEANQGRPGFYLDHIPGVVSHRFPSDGGSGSLCPHWGRSQPKSRASPHLPSLGNVPQVPGTPCLREGRPLRAVPEAQAVPVTAGTVWAFPALSPVNV